MRSFEGGRHNNSSSRRKPCLPRFAVRDGVEASDIEAAKNPDLSGIMSLGSGDDDVISAMLESSHSQGSLAGVMAPLTSPDIYTSFSSHAASFQQAGSGGLARASSMSQPGLSRQPQQQQRSSERWDDKWMLDAKGEVLAMHSAAFGAEFDSFMMPPASSGGGGGLHRYHSAPSTFLQALADDAFAQFPFTEGALTPITEQMDAERGGSGGGSNEFEQFLAPDSEFSRRAALSALAKPETTELVRQNSLPVAQTRQDSTEEHQSEESLSGTSEDNSLKASIYHDHFPRDSWPTSPGTSKRPRGFAMESDPAAAGGEFRNGLIRHASLPTPSASAAAAAAAAAPTADDHYVQMRARAKRGCATHPRSIAERVRRTRISERMKKLQDLVPNMEKTTNTSDMLDETVEYVKSLQMQVNDLNETIAKLRAATQSAAASP